MFRIVFGSCPSLTYFGSERELCFGEVKRAQAANLETDLRSNFYFKVNFLLLTDNKNLNHPIYKYFKNHPIYKYFKMSYIQ